MGECLIIRSGGGTDTSGATATAARVLSGYTCYVNDSKITGTMTNQGTKNASLNAGGSYTIPAGYHNGSGKVTANALSGQTSGTAGAAHILSGYNAWVNGVNTWGNMPNWGNISHSLPANGTYTVPAGWHAGGGVVNQSLAFHWGGTYTPNTANQVICWAWYAAGNIVVLGSSALTAGNIRNGVWIFGVLGNFVGFVDSSLNYGSYFNVTTNYAEMWNSREWDSLDCWMVEGAEISLDRSSVLYNNGYRYINITCTAGLWNNASGTVYLWCDLWWVQGGAWRVYSNNYASWGSRSSSIKEYTVTHKASLRSGYDQRPVARIGFSRANNVSQYGVLRSWSITITKS